VSRVPQFKIIGRYKQEIQSFIYLFISKQLLK
jgi:hypothetical protein